MRSFTSYFLAMLMVATVAAQSRVLAQDLPKEVPIHDETFEERGTSYTLSSKKEVVAAWYVNVSRQIIGYCADRLIVQILPAGTPQATSQKLLDQARWACVLDTFTDQREKGELPSDAVLVKNGK